MISLKTHHAELIPLWHFVVCITSVDRFSTSKCIKISQKPLQAYNHVLTADASFQWDFNMRCFAVKSLNVELSIPTQRCEPVINIIRKYCIWDGYTNKCCYENINKRKRSYRAIRRHMKLLRWQNRHFGTSLTETHVKVVLQNPCHGNPYIAQFDSVCL